MNRINKIQDTNNNITAGQWGDWKQNLHIVTLETATWNWYKVFTIAALRVCPAVAGLMTWLASPSVDNYNEKIELETLMIILNQFMLVRYA